MKKPLAALALGISLGIMGTATAEDAGNPTCVLMKFTDDTRYDLIESADTLSDLVMEKMVASGKFRLKETRPIDENMEAMLYDEKIRELSSLDTALSTGDFNAVFEGPGFSESKAQSIATASTGQIVTPAITSEIGNAHDAGYLVQGTIINLGVGNWWNSDFDQMSNAVNMSTAMTGSIVAPNLLGSLGPLGSMLGGIDIKTTGIGVQCDIRIIIVFVKEIRPDGWAYGSYAPLNKKKRVYRWFRMNDLQGYANFQNYEATIYGDASGEKNYAVTRTRTGTAKTGYLAKDDKVTVVAERGDNLKIIFTDDSVKYRMGWINKAWTQEGASYGYGYDNSGFPAVEPELPGTGYEPLPIGDTMPDDTGFSNVPMEDSGVYTEANSTQPDSDVYIEADSPPPDTENIEPMPMPSEAATEINGENRPESTATSKNGIESVG